MNDENNVNNGNNDDDDDDVDYEDDVVLFSTAHIFSAYEALKVLHSYLMQRPCDSGE